MNKEKKGKKKNFVVGGVHRFGELKEKTNLRFYKLKVTEKVPRERETYGDGGNDVILGCDVIVITVEKLM